MSRRPIIVVGALALVACNSRSRTADERPRVATVGGEPIFVEDFRRELARVRLEDDEGVPAAANELSQRRALLDDLIDRRLLLREAERHNTVISSDEVEAALLRMHSGWTDDELKSWLVDRGVSEADLGHDVREMLLVRKYLVEQVFARVVVTDEEIDVYLDERPELAAVPEKVRARQIVVKTEDQAQEILRRIRGGLPFEEAAMQDSLSPEGKSGGDLGFFARGSMPKIFDEVCFGLQPGEISKVVASDYGFHIFQVLERRVAMARSPEEVRAEAERALRRAKEAQAQRDKLAELRRAANIKIEEGLLAQIN